MAIDPFLLRSVARGVVGLGIALLLAASLGCYTRWLPVYLSAAAALLTMLANGLLIAHSTKAAGDYDSLPLNASGGNRSSNRGGMFGRGSGNAGSNKDENKADLDVKTCVQGYALLPITVTSIVSLAMYKAVADVSSGGDSADKHQVFAVALLEFLDCGGVLQNSTSTHDDEQLTLSFHKKFLSGVMWAVISYLTIYGCRALATARFPSEEEDSADKRTSRLVARAAFGITIVLLVFAAIGFAPLILTCVACGICVAANLTMLMQESTPRMLMHTHCFMVVTLSTIFCLATLLFELKAMGHTVDRAQVYLHLTGFQQAFFAACWFAGTLALRDIFKAMEAAPPR